MEERFGIRLELQRVVGVLVLDDLPIRPGERPDKLARGAVVDDAIVLGQEQAKRRAGSAGSHATTSTSGGVMRPSTAKWWSPTPVWSYS